MEQQTKRSYAKRYVRPRNPEPMVVTAEDIQILRLVAKYKFLTATELVRLLGPRMKVVRYPEYREGEELRGVTATGRRMKRLFSNGYLSRPPRQGDHLRAPGQIVHGLGDAGADLLAEQDGQPLGTSNWQRKSRYVGQSHIEHSRMIGRARMALNLSLPTDTIDFIDEEDWRPEGPMLKVEVYLEGQDKPERRTPDAFFKLKVPGDQFNFLLDCQRNNTEKKRLLPRFKTYLEGREIYYERLGITRLRSLWLANSEARRDWMLTVAKEGLNDGQGSSMFLFAAEHNPNISREDSEHCFNIANPQSLLAPIWKCGLENCEKLHSLLS